MRTYIGLAALLVCPAAAAAQPILDEIVGCPQPAEVRLPADPQVDLLGSDPTQAWEVTAIVNVLVPDRFTRAVFYRGVDRLVCTYAFGQMPSGLPGELPGDEGGPLITFMAMKDFPQGSCDPTGWPGASDTAAVRYITNELATAKVTCK